VIFMIQQIAQRINDAQKIVIFTGAGISTESGIADFRGPDGLWQKYDPDDFYITKFMASHENRARYWGLMKELYPTLAYAQPNPAHYAITQLEQRGKLLAVITQNVDNLHQKAGTSPQLVIELHGTLHTAHCLSCGKTYLMEEIWQQLNKGMIQVPECSDCGGIVKTSGVSFGEALPQEALNRAIAYSQQCDLFIVIGSSLVVYPAAEMPLIAKRHGATLVIVNAEETPFDHLADFIVRGKAGDILPQVIDMAFP
jgi:NAD-dependent deacetylase